MFEPFSDDFPLRLISGLIVNFEIAMFALLIGLLFGGTLAVLARLNFPFLSASIAAVIAVLRATPVFIAMFFLAGVLRPYNDWLDQYFAEPKAMFVTLACLPYIGSYAYDQIADALTQWHKGNKQSAMLLIPNMARSFQVLVSASCFGAAIGVNEAMNAVLTEAELLGDSPMRWGLYAFTVLIFFGLMQTVVATSRWLHRVVTRNFPNDLDHT